MQTTYTCDYCSRTFTDRSNKFRHQKYRCTAAVSYTAPQPAAPQPASKSQPVKTATPNLNNDIMSILSKQNEKIDELRQHLKEQKPQQIIHNNILNNITIYVTEKVDFIKILTERFGDETKAINHIKERMHQKLDGDVDLFCDIYLNGPKETWSLCCPDKKGNLFQLLDVNNNIIDDPGGVKLHKNFRTNYQDTLLRISNKELEKVVNYKVGSDDFETRRDYLLDEFDLKSIQDKIYDLCQVGHIPFIKKLSGKADLGGKSPVFSYLDIAPHFKT